MPASPPVERGVTQADQRPAVRVWATAEIVLILGLIFTIIWVVQPLRLPDVDLMLGVLAGALLLASAWFHHDSRERLGLRLDNFWKALTSVLPISLVAG